MVLGDALLLDVDELDADEIDVDELADSELADPELADPELESAAVPQAASISSSGAEAMAKRTRVTVRVYANPVAASRLSPQPARTRRGDPARCR